VYEGLRFDLHAYQYAVLVDWRELTPDAEHGWDRLCDHLRGRGVEDLDGALLSLELAAVHHALCRVLEPGLVRNFVTLVEEIEAPRSLRPVGAKERAALLAEHETVSELLARGVNFLEEARAAYFTRIKPAPSITGPSAELQAEEAVNEAALLETRLRERVRALLRLPQLESRFAAAWPIEARAVLPSHSPMRNGSFVWAPVLAWAVLSVLGESLDMADPTQPALAVFDAFRLRHVLAESFKELNFSGEDTWRAAARVRLALAAGVRPPSPAPLIVTVAVTEKKLPGFSREVWDEPEVRWLTGVHDADGVTYFNKESFDSLLWWMALPELALLATPSVPAKTALRELENRLVEGSAAAVRAGYRLDRVVAPAPVEVKPSPGAEAGGKPEGASDDRAGASSTNGSRSEPAAEADSPVTLSVPGAAAVETAKAVSAIQRTSPLLESVWED
jgi:hypothetical protein